MNNLIILFLIVLSFFRTEAQNITLQWSNSLGGSGMDIPSSVIKDQYGSGYYVIGREASVDGDITFHFGAPASPNLWLIKTDSTGNKIWDKSFGGSSGESGLKIFQTSDMGFILCGTAGSVDGDVVGNHPWPPNPAAGTNDFWIFKVDSSMNIIWQRCLGGTDSDHLKDVIVTSDGGYLLVGDVSSNDGDITGYHNGEDYWVVKLDSSGNILWQKCLGTGQFDAGVSCIELPDSNYVIAGATQSSFINYHGSTDIGIFKLSKTGSILTNRCYGGSNIDQPCKIISTLDGGYYVIGTTSSNDGDVTNFTAYYDIWIFKANINGDIIWQKCYGGNGIDRSYDAKLTNEKGLLFTGDSDSNDSLYVQGTHGVSDIWAAEIDSMGSLKWGKSLGGSLDDIGTSILQLDANNFILAAESQSSNDDIVFNHGSKDIWLAKLTDSGNTIAAMETKNDSFNAYIKEGIVFINFFSTKSCNMDLYIFDILGKEKIQKSVVAHTGFNQFAFPFSNWNGLKVVSMGNFKKIIY